MSVAALSHPDWRRPGCGPSCLHWQHDPLAHELWGRQQERLGIVGSIVKTGPLVIDLQARTVTVYGEDVWLTAREWLVLEHLARHAGDYCAAIEIVRGAWGESYVNGFINSGGSRADTHLVTVTVSRLRIKFGEAGRLIEAVKALGSRGRRLRMEPPI